ncbi:MAG: hypothetical protein M3Q05_03770 [Bacteroidota bacterium]|nr:hypothetical protein [Bacteroidota bacterium]
MVLVSTSFLNLKTGLIFSALTLVLSLQVSAQIAFTNDAQLKAETRRSRREAARTEAEYKETHLNTSNFTYKKGKSGRKRVDIQEGWETYKFNGPENFIYTEPKNLKFKRKADRKKRD